MAINQKHYESIQNAVTNDIATRVDSLMGFAAPTILEDDLEDIPEQPGVFALAQVNFTTREALLIDDANEGWPMISGFVAFQIYQPEGEGLGQPLQNADKLIAAYRSLQLTGTPDAVLIEFETGSVSKVPSTRFGYSQTNVTLPFESEALEV